MTKCCNIKIRDLSHRITIRRFTESKDGNGWDTSTWSDYTSAWAIIKPLSSHEKLQAQQLEGMVSHKIIVRYSDTNIAITNGDIVKYGSRYFNIRGVINIDEEDRFVRLDAIESEEAEKAAS